MHVSGRTQWCHRGATPWVVGLVLVGAVGAAAGPRRAVKPLVTAQVAPAKQVRATLGVRVQALDPASAQLHALVAQFGAEVTAERRSNEHSVTVRVPPQAVDRLLDAVATLGETTYREKSMEDARPALAQVARRRPQVAQELERAERAASALQVEGDASRLKPELAELREELQGLDAEQSALEDAVARAWVDVSLTTQAPTPPEEQVSDRDINFYPGVRFASLVDVGNTGAVPLWGVGLSVQPAQWLSFEASFFRAAARLTGREGADAFLVTMGLDATSRLFGRGKRRFFNPHLGLRLGVGASFGRVDAVTGVSVGLEVVRLQRLVVDVQVRALGQWLNRSGPHVGVESGVTLATAW